MLGSNVVMIKGTGFLYRKFQHLLGSRSKRNISDYERVGTARQVLLQFGFNLIQIDTGFLQKRYRNAAAVLDDSLENMLGTQIFVSI